MIRSMMACVDEVAAKPTVGLIGQIPLLVSSQAFQIGMHCIAVMMIWQDGQ